MEVMQALLQPSTVTMYIILVFHPETASPLETVKFAFTRNLSSAIHLITLAIGTRINISIADFQKQEKVDLVSKCNKTQARLSMVKELTFQTLWQTSQFQKEKQFLDGTPK
jgi:hypothetical protein